MFDNYARSINYLRISVTNKCNLRCKYCMPEEGIKKLSHSHILTLEEITRLVRIAAKLGVSKVRLTGGEPLVRKNITELIANIAGIPQINDLAITTNGILFESLADELKNAGLKRVNFSLDSLKPETFNYITSRGDLKLVMRAIDKALNIGLNPVKINTVAMKGINDSEILDFARLAYETPLHVRFIEFMPVGDLPFYETDRLLKVNEIKETIQQKYELVGFQPVQGNGPAKSYKLSGGLGTVGFISPMSEHFCGECNRIRLTADGKLRNCLFSKQEINLKLALENTADDEELASLFDKAIKQKPDRHHMNEGWGSDNSRKMYQIGG